MGDAKEEEPKRWWKTLPGILVAIAGLLSAVGSLLVALHTIGVLDLADGNSEPPGESLRWDESHWDQSVWE